MKIDEKILEAHKISPDEYKEILSILGREPNLLELGVISAMWSEHCSYKSSKKYLSGFAVSAPWVIQGPGENAGVIDIGGGYAAVFKIESHNHPSFIEPFAGAATGVGGIMRDVFTMGARVVASLNSLKFGDIKDEKVAKYQKYLVKGVVSGIAHYGNCMGVPTIGGEVEFEPCFNGNILVNAFALGVAKKEDIFYAKAEGVGNKVIYVGSKTGRDGLGGAVMASDSFSEANKSLRPTVQIGDPFAEKLLMESCLELFKTGYIIGIQDMGAAGLTSSSFEMASKSGAGMRLNLDKVPMRESEMNPYELMLSESQERMLICAKKGFEDEIIKLFNKWQLDCAVIGEVTDTGQMQLFWHEELVGELPIAPLSANAPVLSRPVKEPEGFKDAKPYEFKLKNSAQDTLIKLLSNENASDKGFIYEQFDASVGTNTLKADGALGASVIRVKENGAALAMAVECNSRLNAINPRLGAALNVMNAARKVACTGATPLAITDCLNYGNPQNPEVMWQFAMGCAGIKEACAALNTPVVSGNVSLYNETAGLSVYPSPVIVCVGLCESAQKTLKSAFNKAGVSVYLAGDLTFTQKPQFSGSLVARVQDNAVCGALKELDYSRELALYKLIKMANEKNLLAFANSVGLGGVALTLAKMCAISEFGVEANLNLNVNSNSAQDGALLFEESPGRVIIGVLNEKEFENLALSLNLSILRLGATTSENKFKLNSINLNTDELKSAYFTSFERDMQ